MIGGEIDEGEQRRLGRLLGDQPHGLVVEEAVRLDVPGAEIARIEEVLDAGGGLEAARAHEGAIGRIERQRAVAAAAQRQRQPALDPPRGDAGDEIGEAAERARRQAGQHVVLGHPARAAAALGEELALLAVEGLEVAAIAGRHLDAIGLTNVEARLVMDHDDVRAAAGDMTGIHQRHLQPLGRGGFRFHKTVIDEVGNRRHARAGEFREIAVVVIAAPGLVRPGDGLAGQRGQTGQQAGDRRQAANAERIEPPQRVHQGNGDEAGQDHRPAQVRKDREQERRGVAVDHHHVDEVRGHLHDVVLEPRQQHQCHQQRQRQRARQRRTPQQRDEEEVQDSPGQHKGQATAEIGLGLQHDRQRRHVRCSNGR